MQKQLYQNKWHKKKEILTWFLLGKKCTFLTNTRRLTSQKMPLSKLSKTC
jgi:hypothetical protein